MKSRDCYSACIYLLALSVTGLPPADAADELLYPLSIAASGDAIFLADRDFHGVWQVRDGQLSVLFKGQPKFRTPLNAIRCVEIDREGKLLAGDSATREIYRFDDQGQPVPLTKGQIGIPMDLAVASNGDIYASDLETHRIVKVPKSGGETQEVARINACRGLFVDNEDHLWVVSTSADQVYRIAPDGSQEVIVKGRAFEFPHTMVVDSDLTAYVCDGYAKTIWKIPRGGEPVAWARGEPLKNPVGMALQGDKLLVVDPHAKAVLQIDSAGMISRLELRTE